MASFRQNRDKLQELLEDIDVGKIQLPCFQRDYKWNASQVKKLLDSLQKDHPAGSLLLLEVSPTKQLIKEQRFKYTTHPENVISDFLVLDGQQRLTSCYCALYNKGNKTYFLDLNKLFIMDKENNDEIDFEDIVVHKRHESFPDHRLNENLLPLSFLKNKDTFREHLKSYKDSFRNDSSKIEYLNFLELRLEKYIDTLMNYEFPTTILPKDLTLDAVCKVFQTINTTGLKLSAFDICVAKFMPSGIDLKTKIKIAIESDNVKIALKDDETIALQAIALLSGKHPKKNKLADTLANDDIVSWWDKVIEGFDYAIRILDSFGCGCCKNLSLLPYKPVLPILAALYVTKDVNNLGLAKQSDFENKIRKFFYYTSMSLRYTEGTDNKIYEDYHTMLKWVNSGKEPAIIEAGIQWNLKKYISAKSGGAIGKTILCIINSRNPKDFYLHKNVGVGLNTDNCDKHHIFPKAKYQSYDEQLINSVFNMTFLTRESNNFIKDKVTNEYFYELLKEKGIPEEVGKSTLKDHFIGGRTFLAFMNEKLDEFLELRAKEIKNYLVSDVGLKIIDVDSEEIDSIVDEDLENDDE